MYAYISIASKIQLVASLVKAAQVQETNSFFFYISQVHACKQTNEEETNFLAVAFQTLTNKQKSTNQCHNVQWITIVG